MKYKVGDIVRVRENLNTEDRYFMEDGNDDIVNRDMLEFKGLPVTILNVWRTGYEIKEDNGDYNWVDSMLEPIKTRGFEMVVDEHKKHDNATVINMPLRATKTSAGYDFYTPIDISIPPQCKVLVWTDVKAYMPQGEFLMLDVTSGIGTKKDCMLGNTIGIADADYYGCKGNDGNLGICLRNLKPQFELNGFTLIETARKWNEKLGFWEENPQINVPNIIDLTQENTVVFKAGEKIAQGIFVKYQSADNCNGDEVRTGGFGSTDKK